MEEYEILKSIKYDNIIKVPLIFFAPKEDFSRVFDSQVQQIDIVPTVLEALKVKYDGDLDGTSLWSDNIVKGKETEDPFTFSEIVRESLGIELRCVRSSTSKLIYDYVNNISELYDLRVDPEEKNNLWPGEDYDEKTALTAELEAFSKIDSDVNVASSEDEQRQIEKTLRYLGYVD